ncbi:PCRF domain-containing protein, partial [candidate division KSB1 bacterium]|nr:PCRF domain-containing protein [candidate division KSB1 bacterium]
MKNYRPSRSASTISGGLFEVDKKIAEIAGLEAESQKSGFWNDNEKAQGVMREISARKEIVGAWRKIQDGCTSSRELLQLVQEEGDESLGEEIERDVGALEKKVAELEFRRMLGNPEDSKNAILTIHPGAGGTESQDWAQMLLRMYQRWIERQGFKSDILDFQAGD